MNNFPIPIVEDHISRNILLYEIDKVDRTVTGENARSAQKYETAVRLLTYNKRFCDMTYDVAMFTVFRCPSCDTFFNTTSKIERHSTGCSKRVKHVYLRSVYQIRETFFYKLNFLEPNTRTSTRFSKNKRFSDTNTTKWIDKIFPIQSPFHQTWQINQFSFATLVLTILLHLLKHVLIFLVPRGTD